MGCGVTYQTSQHNRLEQLLNLVLRIWVLLLERTMNMDGDLFELTLHTPWSLQQYHRRLPTLHLRLHRPCHLFHLRLLLSRFRLKLNLLSEAASILPLHPLALTSTYRIATPVITRNGYRLPTATFFLHLIILSASV